MNKELKYWLRDYTDNELDDKLDEVRSRMQRARFVMVGTSTPDTRQEYQDAQSEFLIVLEEVAFRWKCRDKRK